MPVNPSLPGRPKAGQKRPLFFHLQNVGSPKGPGGVPCAMVSCPLRHRSLTPSKLAGASARALQVLASSTRSQTPLSQLSRTPRFFCGLRLILKYLATGKQAFRLIDSAGSPEADPEAGTGVETIDW